MATVMSNLGPAGQVFTQSPPPRVQSANRSGEQLHGAPHVSPAVTDRLAFGNQPVCPAHTNDPPTEKAGLDADKQPLGQPGRIMANAAIDVNVGHAAYVINGMLGKVLNNEFGQSMCYMFQSSMLMKTQVQGRQKVVAANTLFKINARAKRGTTHVPDVKAPFVTTCSQPSQQHQAAVAAMSTDKMILPWSDFDLNAVVERLAKCVSKFAIWGVLDVADLCNSANANVRMITTRTRSHAGREDVYVSAELWYCEPHAAAALVYATTGAGGQVTLDSVAVGEAGRPMIPDMSDGKLALACYRALYLLGCMYDYAGLGSHWAYAFTRGIHASATVIAHTDEGGYVRDVLRRGTFERPHGVILRHERTHWGGLLPSMGTSLSALQSCIMSCLLTTAAAVALADPTVQVGDDIYPEVITVNANVPMWVMRDVERCPPNAEVELLAAQAVAEASYRFSKNYVYVLSKLFGFVEVDYKPAEHLCASFSWYTATAVQQVNQDSGQLEPYVSVSRHLLRTGHYWYWIEPTGILLDMFDEMPAAKILSGPRAIPGQDKEYRALPCAAAPKDVLGASGLVLHYKSARRTPALDYLRESPTDGLAFLRVARLDPQCVSCCGVDDSNGTDGLITLLKRKPSIADLLWSRGDARVNAPCETMVIGTDMAVVAVHNTCVTEAGGVKLTPLPLGDELVNWTITYSVATPKYVGVYDVKHVPVKTRQMRSVADGAFAAALTAYNHSPVSIFDWMGPTDDTYLTSLVTHKVACDAVTFGGDTQQAEPGEAIAVAMDCYFDDTKDLTEPMPGPMVVDTPVNIESKTTQIKQKHAATPVAMRRTQQPDVIAHYGLEAPGVEILTGHLNGYTNFGPVKVADDNYDIMIYAASAGTRANNVPTQAIVLCDDDLNTDILAGSTKSGELWFGRYTEREVTRSGVTSTVPCVATLDGKKYDIDWYTGARLLQTDKLADYVKELADEQLADRYVARIPKTMPVKAAIPCSIEGLGDPQCTGGGTGKPPEVQ